MSDYIDKIPELNSGNYSIWSSRVKAVMILKRCWFAIENHRPAPQINQAQPNDDDQEDNQDPGANVPENLEEIHTWDFANNDAKSIMTLTITNADNEKIKRLATAKQAWDRLKSDYTRSNSLEKTKLLGKISVIKFESSVPLAKHLDEMIAMFDRLQDLGEEMSEIFKVNFLLESLKHDSRFRNIITNIRMWEENNKTVSRVRNELIAQMEDIVQVHDRNSGNKMRQNQSGEINNNALLAHAGLECGYCREIGHIKRNCPKKKIADAKGNQEDRKKDDKSGFNYKSNQNWYVDSGADVHISNSNSFFNSLKYKDLPVIQGLNNATIKPIAVGDIHLECIKENLNLNKSLYAPDSSVNLLSVSEITKEQGTKVVFVGNKAKIFRKNRLILEANNINGLYCFQTLDNQVTHPATQENNQDNSLDKSNKDESTEKCVHEWHEILSHRNLYDIRRMKNLSIRKCNCTDKCITCLKAKMTRKPFNQESSKKDDILEVIVSDLCGPIPKQTHDGKKYFITFTDVYSKYTDVQLLKDKAETPEVVIQYIEKIKTKFQRKPKTLRTDRGTEYTNKKFQDYLKEEGIEYQTTVGYAPEQNGIAERKNRTLIEAARSMLFDAKLPEYFWGDAVQEASYNLNRVPGKGAEETPYKLFYKKDPKYNDVHKFGSNVYVLTPEVKRRKLGEKGIKMKFIGHDQNSTRYKLLVIQSSIKQGRSDRF
jgi:hypothetical protein